MSETKLAVGDHVARRVRRYSIDPRVDGTLQWTRWAWRVVDIDPGNPENVRVENVHGNREFTTASRLRRLPHREWITEPSWLDEEGKPK